MKKVFGFCKALMMVGVISISPLLAMPSFAGPLSVRAYTPSSSVDGVHRPVMTLSGVWNFKYSANGRWTTVKVPGEVAMQGYAIEHDKPFFYSKSFMVPADYAGKRVILRFDGVYSHAKLSINGKFVREHHGGFTRWDTDVTPFVRPGKKMRYSLRWKIVLTTSLMLRAMPITP